MSSLAGGLDTNTAFEIVSIDIADIDVGENIGARLQSDQAEADTRVAQARAEARRAEAIADEQAMKARVAARRAALVLAEAEVPAAMAVAFRAGLLHTKHSQKAPKGRGRDPRLPSSATNPRQPDQPRPEQPATKQQGGPE